jgi:putative ABC transport system ATP-binding protein
MNERKPRTMSDSASGPVLEFIDVVKSYGSGPTETRALTSVDLRVEPGEFVAVMGPSGCGKSTLLHLAGGLEAVTAGRVLVNGRDVSTMSASDLATLRRRDVGYIFQRLNLIPSLTAVENVMLPLELDGVGRGESRERAVNALQNVGLSHHLDRYPTEFSGGQQQRIAIARSLVAQRSLLLADEPTGSLDSVNSDEVIELLAELPAQHGTAVILVTHEPRFASWAHRVIFLRDGQVADEAR